MRTKRNLYALALSILMAAVPCAAENTDPDGDGSQYAYGENVGWLNAEPSGNGGPGVHVFDFELTGWIWGENIGWVSLSCKNTLSCDNVGYGVRNNGRGVLSGVAWAENTGWINFSPQFAGVSIDPATGVFAGHAWGENIGWVAFGSAGPNPYRVKTGWTCDPPPVPPAGSPVLFVGEAEGETLLEWTALSGGTGYDIVHGELTTLRTSTTPFVASTLGCIGENHTTTALPFPTDPAAHNGFWFLVRGANCGGSGTQDTGEPSQVGPRDSGIGGSGNDCL